MDVCDDASVLAGVARVINEAGRIDVLVNNAGFALNGFAEEATICQVEKQFNTNYFGVVRLTNAVLPFMRRQRAGTIINISSIAGLIGTPGKGHYCAVKSALEGYSEATRYEVSDFGIHVCLVEPGHFNTGFTKVIASNRIADYNHLREELTKAFKANSRYGGDPMVVAELIAKIAESRRPHLFRHLVGREARLFALLHAILPDSIFAWGMRKWHRMKEARPRPAFRPQVIPKRAEAAKL
jgi:NAD(P)-dependent dehydrogenase (short-subunit alcohol dehydrogenase family)